MRRLVMAGILVALAAAPAAAQGVDSTRIRMTPADSRLDPIIGTTVSNDGQTIRLVPSGRTDTVAYSIGAIDKLESSLGRRSNFGRGALIGGVTGLTLGSLLALLASDEPGTEMVSPVGAAASTGLMGVLLGGAIGVFSQSERWTASPSVNVNRASGGVDLGMQMRVELGQDER